ncbi:MAG: efflux RND transporter permease subunit, partial [Syntrophobacteraceae bacterium]
FFIKKGLHDHSSEQAAESKKKFNPLNAIQTIYNAAIVFFMRHKFSAMVTGVAAIVLGVVLFRCVPQQFFPSAERNQFVIDVWMPEGSRFEATDAVMRRIEAYLREQKGVANFATFIGQSAPRFYYNVDPQQPDAAYGQFIVNTRSEKQTPALVNTLRTKLASVAPEALVIVKELQQGMALSAPVEVRIVGDQTSELERLGARVEKLIEQVPYSAFVHTDYFNDSAMVDVRVNEELANRLGITSSSVSELLAGAFDGLPVSTFWEGDRDVKIMLRLDKASRSSFSDLRNVYAYSQVTRARVPLRALSTLSPQWQTSRIVRRNGVRTLTVQSFVKEGHYASELLNAVRPEIARLPLPPGYRIEYGGEKENQAEVQPQMLTALGISIVAIFLTLLVQFKNISETLIVMSAIPLALPGAILGLLITRNPFGFTAFMGLISLCGIVVRNSIILVDYIKEKMREGHSLEQAATEAGERRLRPIFLTTMAAAVGVLPMILSGSSLWSPLASVIAIGLICSMFMTLLLIPVLFVIVKSRMIKPAPAVAAAFLAVLILSAAPAHAQTKRLTLPETIDLAVKGNSALKIARLKVVEKARKVASVKADNFPKLSNYTWYMGFSNSQAVSIPVGLVPVPIAQAVPGQGSSTFLLNGTVLAQPVTQLLKIHEATGIARSDESIAESDEKKARNDVILAAHQLYYSILIANAQKEAAGAGLAAAQENLRDARKALIAKNVLEVAVIEARTAVLKSRQSLLAATIQSADLNAELDQLLDLPLDTQLELSDPGPSKGPAGSRDFYLQRAFSRSPEIRAAKATVVKAGRGVTAAREEYIPDVTLFAANTYQHGASFLTNNIGSFGVMVSWDIWDWGKRNDVIGERCAQMSQAEENARRVHDEIAVEVDNAYRKLENQKSLVDVAREALALQKERLRLESNQLKTATISHTKYDEAVAEFKKAESDDLQARLGYDLAVAELNRIAGTFGR